MDDRPEGGADLPDGPREPPVESDDGASTAGFGMPSDSAAVRELADEAAEIRRMVDAGAGSPEAIRELAERLREHRAREEALWRTQVKPTLKREGRGRFRGHRKSGGPAREGDRQPAGSQSMTIGIAVLLLVALVIVAASTTAWLLVLPLVALLAYAWYQGRDSAP